MGPLNWYWDPDGMGFHYRECTNGINQEPLAYLNSLGYMGLVPELVSMMGIIITITPKEAGAGTHGTQDVTGITTTETLRRWDYWG